MLTGTCACAADGNEGGRHQLVTAAVSNGTLYICKVCLMHVLLNKLCADKLLKGLGQLHPSAGVCTTMHHTSRASDKHLLARCRSRSATSAGSRVRPRRARACSTPLSLPEE